MFETDDVDELLAEEFAKMKTAGSAVALRRGLNLISHLVTCVLMLAALVVALLGHPIMGFLACLMIVPGVYGSHLIITASTQACQSRIDELVK